MKEIDLEELRKWETEKRHYLLVDVREIEEHDLFNIGGELAPLTCLKDYLNLFQVDLPIVIYCKRGIRSQLAIQRLQRWGAVGHFYNLRGGILSLLQKPGKI